MNALLIIPAIFALVIVIVLVGGALGAWDSPAERHKNKLDKLVRNIGNAKGFAAAMAKQGRMNVKAELGAPELEVVRRVGLSQAGYLHRCDYCDSPLYINEKNCSGCGAPRN